MQSWREVTSCSFMEEMFLLLHPVSIGEMRPKYEYFGRRIINRFAGLMLQRHHQLLPAKEFVELARRQRESFGLTHFSHS